MTVNYTTLLGLAKPVTGTEATTWGDIVNNQITTLVEEAVAKGATIDVTAGDVTLSTTDGVTNQARNAVLLVTGTPGVSRNVIAPSKSKTYVVKNGSNANVVIKGAATTGVTFIPNQTALVFWNGSDFEFASPSSLSGISNKTSGYTVVASDLGKIINCTANSFTVALTAAATIGSGFSCWVWNTSSTYTDVITIDPNASETIDGQTVLTLYRGEGTQLICNGTNWQTGAKKTMRGYAENMLATDTRPVASGISSLALGVGATASNYNAIAGGVISTASGYASTAYGTNATAIGTLSVALGANAQATAYASTAIGSNSSALSSQAVTGSGAVAIGGSYASGSDSFSAAGANNSSTYGAQGANSIALGYRGKATQYGAIAVGINTVASAQGAIALGERAIASDQAAIAIGEDAQASAIYSFAFGKQASARIIGKFVYGNGGVGQGICQAGLLNLIAITTNATPTIATSDSNAASSSNQIILPNDSTYSFSILVVARRTDVDNESAGYKFEGVIDRNATAASTAIVGTVSKTILAEDTTAWDVNVSADTTNGGLAITVTGEVGKTIRWVATAWTSEVTG